MSGEVSKGMQYPCLGRLVKGCNSNRYTIMILAISGHVIIVYFRGALL